MKRREFLKLGSAASLSILPGVGVSRASQNPSRTFYVSTTGDDEQPGTLELPFATLRRAQRAIRTFRRESPRTAVTVLVRHGTYYPGSTLVFTPEDSGSAEAPVTYAAYPGEKVTLSGGRKLKCRWQTRKSKSICDLAESNPGPFDFTQLFINGKRKVRARYPDFDAADPARGGYISAVRALPAGTSSPDPIADEAVPLRGVLGIEFDPATFTQKRWGKPEEAIIHIFQENGLGTLAWRIRSVDYDRNQIWFADGGYQLGDALDASASAVGKGSRFFVDNVLEEMSVPGEWYLSRQSGTLYFRCEDGTDLDTALVEVPALERIISVQGVDGRPTEYLAFDGFRFAHTESTYFRPHETAPNGNWALFRGGAVVFEQTRSCSIRNCWFDALGSNAIFWSKSNVSGNVSACAFTDCGGSAISFAGTPERTSTGPHSSSTECTAIHNRIQRCGFFQKQSAGIYLSRSQQITVAHNEIVEMPCSGIIIADGAAKGHIIEHNDIRDTARETLHYGPIHICGDGGTDSTPMDGLTANRRDGVDDSTNPRESFILRGNLIRGNSNCAILIGSGASHCDIYNNIAVGSAIRLQRGGSRNIHNNIWYNTGEAVIILSEDGIRDDRYHHNVAVIAGDTTYSVSTSSLPGQSIREIDYNCVFEQGRSFGASITDLRGNATARCDLSRWQELGFDRHSAFADPRFADPARLLFNLLDDSPALKLGFVNIQLNQWGPAGDLTSAWKEAWLQNGRQA